MGWRLKVADDITYERLMEWQLTLKEVGKQDWRVCSCLAERDLLAREAEQIKEDLSAIYEVLERNQRDRQQQLALLVR